jgi:hypothetical protein
MALGYINRLEIEFAVDGPERPKQQPAREEDGVELGARELLRAACRVFVTRTCVGAPPPAADRKP